MNELSIERDQFKHLAGHWEAWGGKTLRRPIGNDQNILSKKT